MKFSTTIFAVLILVAVAVPHFVIAQSQIQFADAVPYHNIPVDRVGPLSFIDLDYDNDLDIIYFGNDGLRSIENLGDGTFGPFTNMYEEDFSGYPEILIADVNNDSYPDITLLTGSSITILLKEATPYLFTVQTQQNDSWLNNLTLRYGNYIDLNMDGSLDLLYISYEESAPVIGRLSYSLNNGSALFGPSAILADHADFDMVMLEDFNQDGMMDIVGHGTSSSYRRFFFLENTGPFQYEPIDSVVSATRQFQAVDFNNDGQPEIIHRDQNSKIELFVLNDSGEWNKNFLTDYSISATDFKVADLNQDGLMDIVAAVSDDYNITFFKNNGDLEFTREKINAKVSSKQSSIYLENMDNDGSLEILQVDNGFHSIDLLELDADYEILGKPYVKPPLLLTEDMTFGDFNGDDQEDFCALYFNYEMCLNGNDETQFTNEAQIRHVNKNGSCNFGDYNNDGLVDSLVLINRSIYFYYLQADGTYLLSDTLSTSNNIESFKCFDANNDNILDIVLQFEGSSFDRDLALFKNDGNGNFTAGGMFVFSEHNVNGLLTTDINADGWEDVVYWCENKHVVFWCENEQDGTFACNQNFGSVSITPSSEIDVVRPVHLNDDELIDFVVSSTHLTVNFYLRNLGGGTFLTTKFQPFECCAEYLEIADINKDGNDDVLLVGNFNSDSESVIFINEPKTSAFDSITTINLPANFQPFIVDLDNDQDLDILLYRREFYPYDYAPIQWMEQISVLPELALTVEENTCGIFELDPQWQGNLNNLEISGDFGDGTPIDNLYDSHTYSKPGMYTITYIACNDVGCDTAYYNLEVTHTIDIDIPSTGQVGTPIAIQDNSIGWTSYSWIFGDGEISTEINPTYAYSSPGTYILEVFLTDSSQVDCTYSITQEVIIEGSSHVSIEIEGPSFVYPNPTQTSLFFESSTFRKNEQLNFQIVDIAGRTVLNGITREGQKIDLQDFSNGIYYLVLSTEDFKRQTMKLYVAR